MNDRLGSAEWADNQKVAQDYEYRPGAFWLGRSLTTEEIPLGAVDDRHICLVSGSRAGKGTTTIINNLCLWPGSVVVIDPKGENASVTAARRGPGGPYCRGMGQKVVVLDPFKVVSNDVPKSLRGRFNPLDALDPADPESIDGAGQIADALVVVKDAKDPFWDESARSLVKGLLLHVLTSPDFDGRRNLITVRELITRGDWRMVRDLEAMKADGKIDKDEAIASGQALLWESVRRSEAFDGVVAGIGETFRSMIDSSPKQFESVIQVANRNTEFIDSPGMRDCLSASDFQLSELKTTPEGFSLYLSLPQRFMNTHYRWLRMMTTLIVNQMEITRLTKEQKQARFDRGTDYQLLMVLDEFAGLKRMESIENAVAQIAGFGVKLFVVLQSLEQLKGTYKDNWETFLANSGVKMFFGIEDHFTRDYIAKLAGETEIVRVVQSTNEGTSESTSETIGSAENWSTGRNQGTSDSEGTNRGTSGGGGTSETQGTGGGKSVTKGTSSGWSESENYEDGASLFNLFTHSKRKSGTGSVSSSGGSSYSESDSTNWSNSTSRSKQWGWSQGTTFQTSRSLGISSSQGGSSNRSTGKTRGLTWTKGRSETIHKRLLINPDEIGRLFSRVDNPFRAIHPGLGLVLITGTLPTIVRRSLYYQDPLFIDTYDAHPDHGFQPPDEAVVFGLVEGENPWGLYFQKARSRELRIGEWLVKPGELVTRNQPVAEVVRKDGTPVRPLVSPFAGIIHSIDTTDLTLTENPDKQRSVSLFTMHYYDFEHRRQTEIQPYGRIMSLARDRHGARMTGIFFLSLLPLLTLAELGFALFLKTGHGDDLIHWLDSLPGPWGGRIIMGPALLYAAFPYTASLALVMLLLIAWLIYREWSYPRGSRRWIMWEKVKRAKSS